MVETGQSHIPNPDEVVKINTLECPTNTDLDKPLILPMSHLDFLEGDGGIMEIKGAPCFSLGRRSPVEFKVQKSKLPLNRQQYSFVEAKVDSLPTITLTFHEVSDLKVVAENWIF